MNAAHGVTLTSVFTEKKPYCFWTRCHTLCFQFMTTLIQSDIENNKKTLDFCNLSYLFYFHNDRGALPNLLIQSLE